MASVLMYVTIELTVMVLIVAFDSATRYGNTYGEFHYDNGLLFGVIAMMLITTIVSLEIL